MGYGNAASAQVSGILDKTITIDGRETRVIGVLPADFEMPTLEAADVVIPQALNEAQERKVGSGSVLYAFARLKPGMTIEQARSALQPLFNYSLSLAPAAFRNEVHLRVRSLRDRQMHDVRLMAWVLLGAVLAVLLISCANVAGLLLVRGASRERELAVRSALGASGARLTRQFLTEALVLSAAGAAVGCAVAEVLLRFLLAMAPETFPFSERSISMDALSWSPSWSHSSAESSSVSHPHGNARAHRRSLVAQQWRSQKLLCGDGWWFRNYRSVRFSLRQPCSYAGAS